MKNKDQETNKITDYKQELIDIYKLTFYKRPSILPFTKDQSTRRKLSANRKVGSVKEILQDYQKQSKEQLQLQPIKQNKFERIILYDENKDLERKQVNQTDRLTISKTNRRYRSVNLTKKYQYLQRNQAQFETRDTQYYSNRQSNNDYNENKCLIDNWKSHQRYHEQNSQISGQIYPVLEQPFQNKIVNKKMIFPKEFSANGLFKKYFA